MNRNSAIPSISSSREHELRARRPAPSSARPKKSSQTKRSSAATPKKLTTEKKSNKAIVCAPDVLEPTSHMRLITAQELIEKTVPRRKQHWGMRILAHQIGMLYGPRGKGKTWLSMAIAVSMSSGVEFLDFAPKKPRRVIYLDGEMDLATIKERLMSTAQSLGTTLSSSLRIFTPETFNGLLPSITQADGQREIDRLIGTDWDVLFIDNYSSWSGDGRETAESWTPLMRWMLLHKHAGRCVIVIHHSGKNGEQRGSSRHEDALDWSIALKPSSDAAQDGALGVELTWKKSRHLPSDEAYPISARMQKNEAGILKWTHQRGVGVDARIAEARALSAAKWSNAKIAEKLGVDRSTIGRWLKD